MKDISNIIKIDSLEVDYTLSYFNDEPYLFMLFLQSENTKVVENNPIVKLIEEIAKDYNFNILKKDCKIPDAILTVIHNNFFITNIEEGIVSATINLIDEQLDLSSLYSYTETVIETKVDDTHIVKKTQYMSENGKIDITLEQSVNKSRLEDYGDEYLYSVLIKDAIEKENYENAEKYTKIMADIKNKKVST